MGVFFGSTEITGIKNLFPSIAKDITELYFGDLELFTVWDTYEGALPAQFNANGNNLKNYQIWGNTGGVGKETGNLFDQDNLPLTGYLNGDGTVVSNSSWGISDYIPVKSEQIYRIQNSRGNSPGYCFYDDNKEYISGEGFQNRNGFNVTTPSTAKYIRVSVSTTSSSSSYNKEIFMLTEGSTAPDSYVPYGYEVDVEIVDGAKNLFNKNDTPTVGYLIANSAINEDSKWRVSGYIPITSEKTYVISNVAGNSPQYRLYDINKNDIGGNMYSNRSTIQLSNLSSNVAFIRLSVAISTTAPNLDTLMLTEGSTAPESYIPYTSTTTPIYIGISALEKDEYIDSESGKVYRRTDNIFDGQWLQGYYAQSGGAYHEGDTWICFKNKIPCKPNTEYTLKYFANSRYYSIGWYNENDAYISMNTSTVSGEGVAVLTATSPANAAYLACSVAGYPSSSTKIYVDDAADTVLIEGSTAPSSHIPYLQPVDPPVPLPQLPTIDGSTIIEVDSTIQPEKVSLTYRKEGFE